MQSKSEQYIDYINENILPRIDYDALRKSYETEDKIYTKGILNLLHQAMLDIYKTDTLQPDYSGDMEDNFVIIPGVVQGIKSGNLCLALLEIDLSSSGEHWATSFLTEYGVIPQAVNRGIKPQLTALMAKRYIPYDYCYTAQIPDDIHTRFSAMPKAVQEVLRTFRNHIIELPPPETEEIPVKEDEDEEDMER